MNTITLKDLNLLKQEMIFSASGWRGLFSTGETEECASPDLRPGALILASSAAACFGQWLKKETGKARPVVAVGTDTRPTGPALAERVLRGLAVEGIEIRYAGITAAPEITAWVQRDNRIDGFFYITASHNPPGYNGFKFGAGDGSVLEGTANAQITKTLFSWLEDPAELKRREEMTAILGSQTVSEILEKIPVCKADALNHYHAITTEIAGGEPVINEISTTLRNNPMGVAVDFNGSARILSLDRSLFSQLGITLFEAPGAPGLFLHPLIPEGGSLLPCAEIVTQCAASDIPVPLGYVPDTDGDRGNLVILDEQSGKGRPLKAQEVFSLVVLSELCWLRRTGATHPVALAVNGPTSLRIREISDRLGATVFEAEVGEANVVQLARNLQKQGYLIRILGEGSNGGNITFPAVTRDPINTVISMLKLLLIKTQDDSPGLYDIWREAIGLPPAKGNYTLGEILSTLPVWTTTEVTDPLAILKVTSPQDQLKKRYEQIFLDEWKARQSNLFVPLGFARFEQINNEGPISRSGFGPEYRSGTHKGGFKILFRDNAGEPAGFVWMRGSGTEPVFRVMAEVRGDYPERERRLLEWHRSIINRADRISP